MQKRTVKYSEMFRSIQGEGKYVGVPTIWLRFFLCNLQCDGFSQCDPTDPSSYELPYQDFDTKLVNRVEDLPVWNKGCDSSYTWAKKFGHLAKEETYDEVASKLVDLLPSGKFVSGNGEFHLAFTGGEPMLNQRAMSFILFQLTHHLNQYIPAITIETNGTKKIGSEFEYSLQKMSDAGTKLFWSVSPKLFTVSGESPEKAIRPEIVRDYIIKTPYSSGQLKFVVDDTDRCWQELEAVIQLFRDNGVYWPVYLMPVGARDDQQNKEFTRKIVDKCLETGYNYTPRLHCDIFGNTIGT